MDVWGNLGKASLGNPKVIHESRVSGFLPTKGVIRETSQIVLRQRAAQ